MKLLASLFVVVVLIAPFQVLTQKVVIEEVQAEVQPLKDGEFQFHRRGHEKSECEEQEVFSF